MDRERLQDACARQGWQRPRAGAMSRCGERDAAAGRAAGCLRRLTSALMALLLAACGGGDPGADEVKDSDATPHRMVATPSSLVVPQAQSQTVRIDTAGNGSGQAVRYAIGFSETANRVAITTAPCAPGAGSIDCQEWTFTAAADALPGVYPVPLRTLGMPGGEVETTLWLEVTARPAPRFGPAVRVAARDDLGGNTTVLVVTGDGRIVGMGLNDSAQLARGVQTTASVDGSVLRMQPLYSRDFVPVAEPRDGLRWIDVATRGGRVIALRSDGRLFRWGYVDTWPPVPPIVEPVEMAGLRDVRSISAGPDGMLVLGQDGRARHVGNDMPASITPIWEPLGSTTHRDVTGLTAIAGSSFGSVLLAADGRVWEIDCCWGYLARPKPGLPAGITAITAAQRCVIGDDATLAAALAPDGSVWWWRRATGEGLGTPRALAGVRATASISAACVPDLGYVLYGRHADDGSVWRVAFTAAGPGAPAVLPGLPARGALFGRFVVDATCGQAGRVHASDARGRVERLAPFDGDAPVCSEAAPSWTLHVGMTGQGRVWLPSGTWCEGECSVRIPVGSRLDLRAQAAPGWLRHSWTLDGGSDDDDVCSGVVPPAHDGVRCVARFTQQLEADQYRLEVQVIGGGRVLSVPAGIDCSGSCGALFARDATVQLSVQPARGWRLSRIAGHPDCADGTVTMDGARLCGVFFEPLPAPAAPAGLSAGVTPDGAAVMLTWSSGGADVVEWALERSIDGGAFVAVPGRLPSAATSFLDSQVAPGSLASYRLMAVGVNAVGAAAEASARLPALPPPVQHGLWTTAGDAFAGTLNSPAMALDAAGRPVVAWVERAAGASDSHVKVRRWNGAAWQDLGSPNAQSTWSSFAPAVIVDAGGAPVVAWSEALSTTERLLVARWDGTRWSLMCVVSVAAGAGEACRTPLQVVAGVAANRPSLALDRSGRLAMAWLEGGTPRVKRYSPDSGDWVAPAEGTSPPGAAGGAQRVRLQFEPDGTPVLAWASASAAGAGVLQVARGGAGGWTTLPGVPLDPAHGTLYTRALGLATGDAGRPMLAWAQSDGTTARALSSSWDGAGWSAPQAAVTLDNAGPVDGFGFALAADGTPMLALGSTVGGVARVVLARRHPVSGWAAYGTPLDAAARDFAFGAGLPDASGVHAAWLFDVALTSRVWVWLP